MDFGSPFEFTPSDSILQKIKIIPTKEKLTASAGGWKSIFMAVPAAKVLEIEIPNTPA